MSFSVLWNLTGSIIAKGSVVVFTLILARILEPADFGIVAMATMLVVISQTLASGGLGQALVQQEQLQEHDASTVFSVNLLASIILYALVVLAAPYASVFFDEPRLTFVIKLAGLSLIITSLRISHIALMQRAHQFDVLAKIQIFATLISGSFGVALAFFEYGFWSLIGQLLMQQLSITLGCFLHYRWRPKFHIDFMALNRLFGYGGRLALSSFIGTLSRESYTFIVARFFSAEVTGQYYFARRINNLTQQQLITPIQEATFPALSQQQSDLPSVVVAIRKIGQVTSFMIAPMAVFIAILAEPLIMVVVGKKWLPAADYLQILSVLALLYPLHAISINVMKITGRSDLVLRWSILRNILALGLLLIAAPYGVKAIIASQILVSVIILFPNAYHNKKLINYNYSQQVGDVIFNILSALLVGLVASICLNFYDTHITQLIIGCITYSLVYLGLAIATQNKGLNLIIPIVRKRLDLR